MSKSASRVLQFPAIDRKFVRPPRILQTVKRVAHHSFEYAAGYIITFWRQTLACGHKITAHDLETAAQKRRACPECAHALQLAMRAPVIPIANPRKIRRPKSA